MLICVFARTTINQTKCALILVKYTNAMCIQDLQSHFTMRFEDRLRRTEEEEIMLADVFPEEKKRHQRPNE